FRADARNPEPQRWVAPEQQPERAKQNVVTLLGPEPGNLDEHALVRPYSQGETAGRSLTVVELRDAIGESAREQPYALGRHAARDSGLHGRFAKARHPI